MMFLIMREITIEVFHELWTFERFDEKNVQFRIETWMFQLHWHKIHFRSRFVDEFICRPHLRIGKLHFETQIKTTLPHILYVYQEQIWESTIDILETTNKWWHCQFEHDIVSQWQFNLEQRKYMWIESWNKHSTIERNEVECEHFTCSFDMNNIISNIDDEDNLQFITEFCPIMKHWNITMQQNKEKHRMNGAFFLIEIFFHFVVIFRNFCWISCNIFKNNIRQFYIWKSIIWLLSLCS